MFLLKEKTLGELWISAMRTVVECGEKILDEDVPLREVRNLYMEIEMIDEDDSLLKKYADQNRIKLMKEKYSTCGLVGDYKIDYGSYIYNNNGVNQINWIVNRIRSKPETKSATITLHKPGEKMLACLSLIDFKYRKEKLDMTVVYRSQNIFASQPGNMVALRHIQEDVARELGYDIGVVELAVISAHIYENDMMQVNDILKSADKTKQL